MTPASVARALALAGCIALAACGATDNSADVAQEAPSPTELTPQPPAVAASPGTEGDVARFQRLSVETLRLMITAAQRELPIGPVQERINDARRVVRTDPAEAAEQLETIVADLQAMLEASQN